MVTDIQRSISFRDTPIGIVGAEDPKPEDLVAEVEEYEIGPGDTLQIRLLDFVQLGAETELSPTVDELGYIDMPQLERVKAAGRTARELQSDIIQKAKALGIYHMDSSPTVTVTVANPVQRMYNLSGAVLYAGPYRIARPDFRVREAINLGGGMDDSAKFVWVFRNGSAGRKVVRDRGAAATSPAEQAAPAEAAPAIPVPPSPNPLPAPPVSPVLMSETSVGSPTQSAPAKPHPSERPNNGSLALPADEVPGDLIEAVKPPHAVSTQSTPASAAPAGPAGGGAPATGTAGGLPSYKFVNDGFIEVPKQPEQRRSAVRPPSEAAGTPTITPAPPSSLSTPTGAARVTPPPAAPSGSPKVDWEELASEVQHRIIRIPAAKLRNGDPNYNVVIRNNDWVRVDPGPVGFYYMAGYVARPGPYALAGEQITLTQAVAAAGGLDQLAWPTRCEIRRRLDGDREEITQWNLARIMDGKDPNVYLKKNDEVRVGTHAIAPLLATIRNSFRFTYGFGFVYDRNFADIDSFSAQANPRDIRRAERQQRFGNLFQ